MNYTKLQKVKYMLLLDIDLFNKIHTVKIKSQNLNFFFKILVTDQKGSNQKHQTNEILNLK